MTKIISIVGGLQPSAPTIGTATAGDTTASVAFTASSYIGKGTITYTATSSPGGFTGTSATSPITVSGLSNGTAYTFTVTGTTNYGVSSVASASSNSITPAAAGAWESIQTITSSSYFASANFTSIPQTYKHLQIRGLVGETASGADTNYLFVQVNGRSSDYWTVVYGMTNSTANSNNGTGRSEFATSLNLYSAGFSNIFGSVILDIYDYTSANKKPSLMSMAGGLSNQTSGYYNNARRGGLLYNGATEPITSILIYPQVNNFKAYTHLALYGLKG